MQKQIRNVCVLVLLSALASLVCATDYSSPRVLQDQAGNVSVDGLCLGQAVNEKQTLLFHETTDSHINYVGIRGRKISSVLGTKLTVDGKEMGSGLCLQSTLFRLLGDPTSTRTELARDIWAYRVVNKDGAPFFVHVRFENYPLNLIYILDYYVSFVED